MHAGAASRNEIFTCSPLALLGLRCRSNCQRLAALSINDSSNRNRPRKRGRRSRSTRRRFASDSVDGSDRFIGHCQVCEPQKRSPLISHRSLVWTNRNTSQLGEEKSRVPFLGAPLAFDRVDVLYIDCAKELEADIACFYIVEVSFGISSS